MAQPPPKVVSESAKAELSGTDIWLQALYDPLANARVQSACLQTANLVNDGNYSILAACPDKKLRVFQDGQLKSTHVLLGVPVALHVLEERYESGQLKVAVASGKNVFIYRNLRPYFKFTLPSIPIPLPETEVWANYNCGKIDLRTMAVDLMRLRENGDDLTHYSGALLSMNNLKEQEAWIESKAPLVKSGAISTVVTCMAKAVSSHLGVEYVNLIVGSEAGNIFILNSTSTGIKAIVRLPSIPVAIVGFYDDDTTLRVFVACRDAVIYSIKNNACLGKIIQHEFPIISLTRSHDHLISTTTNNSVWMHTFRGDYHWHRVLPAYPITCSALVDVTTESKYLWAVSTKQAELYVFYGKRLLSILHLSDTAVGLVFGPVGRESTALTVSTKSGAMYVQLLRRKAVSLLHHLAGKIDQEIAIPPKLPIPKKTKTYIDWTTRERNDCDTMHYLFQRGMVKLKLNAAREYVGLMTSGAANVGIQSQGTKIIKMSAEVLGVGPRFLLRVGLQNHGQKPVSDAAILVCHDPDVYICNRPVTPTGVLLPVRSKYGICSMVTS